MYTCVYVYSENAYIATLYLLTKKFSLLNFFYFCESCQIYFSIYFHWDYPGWAVMKTIMFISDKSSKK